MPLARRLTAPVRLQTLPRMPLAPLRMRLGRQLTRPLTPLLRLRRKLPPKRRTRKTSADLIRTSRAGVHASPGLSPPAQSLPGFRGTSGGQYP